MIKIIRTKAPEKKRKRYVPATPFWKDKTSAQIKRYVSKAIDESLDGGTLKRGDDYRLKK